MGPCESSEKVASVPNTRQECTLNAQQIRAVAPIVCTIDEMWEKRTEASTCFANGQPSERCNCLWLGAGGSGKTWAYTKVLRPLFQRFFGFGRYTAGAPTHAAARLLGAEARTLHKLANISPNSALHRGAIRGQRNKNDALEQQILASLACIVDELSMSAADVYHALGLRFSVKRCENWALDLSRYLQEWFGKMPIGLQLGDFLQLRPAAQASLCEWVEVPSAVEPGFKKPKPQSRPATQPSWGGSCSRTPWALWCTSLELGVSLLVLLAKLWWPFCSTCGKAPP